MCQNILPVTQVEKRGWVQACGSREAVPVEHKSLLRERNDAPFDCDLRHVYSQRLLIHVKCVTTVTIYDQRQTFSLIRNVKRIHRQRVHCVIRSIASLQLV